MPERAIVWLKVAVWAACLLPLLGLAWRAAGNALGPAPPRTLPFTTGLAALRLLVLSLVITPARRLSPRLSWLLRFRRLLGLFAFFYATLHLLTYVGLYSYFDWRAILADVARRRYVTAGLAAWLLLVPLALTSTRASVRRLGRRWVLLHRLVYPAAVLGVVHYWWLVKAGVRTPLTVTVVVALLLAGRPLLARRLRRRQSQAAAAR
jgi:sulfoxide reductase heme-binding subunit YedZ